MPYRVFRPIGYDTPSSSFPLVVFLHGNGERGTNNTAQVTSHIQGLIDRTRSTLDIKTVKTILGAKQRPHL